MSQDDVVATFPKMLSEFARLAVGLLVALFHQPLADFVLKQDRAVVAVARQKGLFLPDVPSARIGRNIYFSLGIFVVVYQLLHIWTLIR